MTRHGGEPAASAPARPAPAWSAPRRALARQTPRVGVPTDVTEPALRRVVPGARLPGRADRAAQAPAAEVVSGTQRPSTVR